MISNWRRHLTNAAQRAASAATSRMALPALAAISVAGTASFSVPVGPFLTAYCIAAPKRWLAFALTTTLATAISGALISFALVTWGAPWIASHIPEITASPEWARLTEWVRAYGLFAMIAWLALPLPQSPFMVLTGLLGVAPIEIATAFLLGKGAKYLVSAYLAAHATKLSIRLAGRFKNRRTQRD